MRLTVERVRGGRKSASGFRVGYGKWRIAGWLNRESLTAIDRAAMLRAERPPVSADVITSCDRLLTVWGDPDAGGKHGKHWAHCLGQLQSAFGLLIWDYDSDNWWVA